MPIPWTDHVARTAGENAAWDASIPAFMGNNVCEDCSAASWRSAAGADTSDTTNFPPEWGFDRQAHAVTKPATLAAGQTECFYRLVLNPDDDQQHMFDGFVILNHNLFTLNCSCSLQIADNVAFTSNLITLGSVTPSSNERIGHFQLTDGTTSRIKPYNVTYMRLRIFKNSGSFSGSELPHFGELWVGKRDQLSFKPRTPWDQYRREADVVDYVADGGQRVRYTKSKGRAVFDLRTHSGGTDPTYSINQNTSLINWWNNCDNGAKPSLFFISGGSSGKISGCFLVHPDPSFGVPLVGPYEREFEITLTESAPYASQEE